MERLTASESEDQQRRVAGALRARGVGASDRVAMLLPRRAAALSAVLGALRSGVIPVVLNAGLLPHERDELLADAEPTLVVTGDDGLAALLAGSPTELAPAPLGRPMQYTSGTTGRPKGVWSGVLDEADALALVQEERDAWGFDARDVHLVVSPLHHSAPIRFSSGTLLAGGDVVVLDRFDVGGFGAAVRQHGPSTAFLVPTHLQRLLREPVDLASFRLVAHAGAPCSEPLKRAALAAFPPGAVWEFYGSTEGQFTVCGPDEWLDRPGTVGRARPGRTLSVDPDGVIWCEVPRWSRFEYWRDPARTAAAWRGDAFSVGDVGRLDADGYLFLDGRRDDLIISGGVNVYPLEVEQAIQRHPGVEDVAVFPVDDDDWGQRVCAAVVGDVDLDALHAWLRTQVAPYKLPKQLLAMEELPRTSTGKVRRSLLAAELGLG
ncbi:MAG TPA: AMP-binding protein [Acidimicrobiales bacterium]|nr:AMP-binding protein [Acidimicrobiales bacterium]